MRVQSLHLLGAGLPQVRFGAPSFYDGSKYVALYCHARVSLVVTYNFHSAAPPAPEPGTCLLFACALPLVIAGRFLHRRRPA